MKNASAFLEACISSIQQQSFTDWELIIVNDHSSDCSFEIAQSLSGKDERIFVFQNQDKGIIPSLCLALEKSRGKYISRMDSDDLMPMSRLQAMMIAMLNAPPKTIVTGFVKYFSDEPVSEGYLKYEEWLNTINKEGTQWQHIYRECVIASPNWMMKKEELLLVGGFEQLVYPEDYDLVLKWYANSFSIVVVPEITLLWREHPSRTSRNSKDYGQPKFFDLKIKAFIAHEFLGQLVLWGAGDKGRLTATMLDQLGIDFVWMDLTKGDKKMDGHVIFHFRNIEQLKDPRLLVAVYPPDKERDKMELYLKSLDMEIGKNYWYL